MGRPRKYPLVVKTNSVEADSVVQSSTVPLPSVQDQKYEKISQIISSAGFDYEFAYMAEHILVAQIKAQGKFLSDQLGNALKCAEEISLAAAKRRPVDEPDK